MGKKRANEFTDEKKQESEEKNGTEKKTALRPKTGLQCIVNENENTSCALVQMGVCIKVENKRNEKSIFIKGKKQKTNKHWRKRRQ